MFSRDLFPKEYLTYLANLNKEDRELIELYYGLNGKAALTLEQLAELRRNPDVNTNAVRGELLQVVAKLRGQYEKYGY